MVVDLNHVPERSNYYANLVASQKFALVPSFVLESGACLTSVPIAYKTWGRLNEAGDNVLVLCHALSGSSDAEDWWGPLMGPGETFDYDRFFIFCGNMLGSPYGSASSLTINPATGHQFGPLFPETTFRDDVRIQKLVLDALGVRHVAAVVGGSMGGMLALEFALSTEVSYVRQVIPITTSAYQGAWGIAWGETQKECIRSDADYHNGWYTPQPETQPQRGLGAARMVAMLTYRSDQSFKARFNRRPAAQTKSTPPSQDCTGLPSPPPSEEGISEHLHVATEDRWEVNSPAMESDDDFRTRMACSRNVATPPKFAAQSYMQYQASKFLNRFDANCYVHLIDKMDTHDVTRSRIPDSDGLQPADDAVGAVFRDIPAGALVVSIESDVLFTHEHQVQLAKLLPEAHLVNLDSSDGHDGFLLEFEALGSLIALHLQKQFPHFYEGDHVSPSNKGRWEDQQFSSVFGEAEPDF